jgi:hypothetical protein
MTTLNQTMASHDQPLADIVRLLGHPDDVLNHPDLTTAEKREVLAFWASHTHSVVGVPSLRQLESGAIVSLDEVLTALQALDETPVSHTSTRPTQSVERRRRSLPGILGSLVRRDDDDDPPPSPTAALPLDLAAARRRKWEPTDTTEPVAA